MTLGATFRIVGEGDENAEVSDGDPERIFPMRINAVANFIDAVIIDYAVMIASGRWCQLCLVS